MYTNNRMTNNYDVQIWHVADTEFNAFWKQNPFFVHHSYLSSYCLCALNWLPAFNRHDQTCIINQPITTSTHTHNRIIDNYDVQILHVAAIGVNAFWKQTPQILTELWPDNTILCQVLPCLH